ncbi:hypothetical protein GCM10023185_03600 [Hymenobacter saemangeumensis]|uniref:STAS/SEC14 domain-containing protein n=1 Tax=Hymenobacter saemangeumensis TaxID=1084522 RepID=A0ABP8HZD3_9BACT
MPLLETNAVALDYLEYQYRTDLEVLVGRWLRQPTEEELRIGYHRLLEAAETFEARLWLIDARRRNHANQQATPWMVETFFPLLGERLGPPVNLAFLFMPSHLKDLEQDVKVPPLTYFDGRPYRVQRFVEEQAAMHWLGTCRTFGPGL